MVQLLRTSTSCRLVRLSCITSFTSCKYHNLSINSIDVLTGLDAVKICTAYELDGEKITEYPANLDQLRRCKPIFEELPGWTEDITGCRSLDELPENAHIT